MLRLNDLILLLVLFASMAAGIAFPAATEALRTYPLYVMMFLMFLSFMTIRPEDIFDTLKKSLGEVALMSFLKLAVLPVAVYAIFRLFYPDYAAGALLLAGVSTGVVAPFISTLVGADGALVLIMVVVTSPLVPLTLPLLVKVLLAAEMELPFVPMMMNLALVVIVPILCVELMKRFFQRALAAMEKRRYPLSLCCFALINIGIFSKYSAFFRQKPQTILEAALVASALALVLGAAGMLILPKKPAHIRIASAISMANINNVLIIVFAARFFGPLEPTLAAIYMIPFFAVILPMRLYIRREGRGR
jgi:BASS family bile acid:Na+ symporter